MKKGAEIYKQAVQIASEINDKRSTGIHLGNLGNLYYFLDKFDEAMGFLTQGVEIAQRLGNKRAEAIHLEGQALYLGL